MSAQAHGYRLATPITGGRGTRLRQLQERASAISRTQHELAVERHQIEDEILHLRLSLTHDEAREYEETK